MKKFLALFLSFMLMLSSVPFAFAANEGLTLSVETKTTKAEVGDTVTFELWLRGIDTVDGGICGVQASLKLPDGLTVDKLKKGEVPFEDEEEEWVIQVSSATLTVVYGGAAAYTDAELLLATLTCKVNENAAGTLTVNIYDNKVVDNSPNPAALSHTTVSASIEVHVHAPSTEWSSDKDYHWHACSCGEQMDKAAHVDEIVDGVCDICARVLCDHDWTEADCENPKTCKLCGATEGDALGHDWKDADCTTPKTCKTCGKTEGDALGHTEEIIEGKEPTCTETGLTEGKKCSVCGEILVAQEVIKALGHDWEIVDETEDEIHLKCKVCGTEMTEIKDNNTEVDVAPDGSVIITTTNEDGTVTTETRKDGVTTTVTTDANGEVISVEVAISSRAAAEAAKNDEAVELNIDAMVADEDLTVTITTNSDEAVAVEVPVLNVTPGCVIVIVNADGTETIVTATKMTEDGLVFDCPDGATIKVVDNSKSFADVKGNNWYNDAIDFVSARGIMTGMTENTFAQNGVTTRAQLWTMLARLSGVDTTCTEGNWYDVARAWAIENGISDGTDANGELTREMLVTMLYRFVGGKGESKSIEGFSDAANASDWAKAALEWAYGEGVMNGNADGTMNPAGETTRAQMAQFFMNFIQNI